MPAFDLAPYRPVALDDLVRVGRDRDGGYLVSRRSMETARVLVGLGINDDWSFEEAFVDARPDVQVIGVDGSVSAGVFRERAREELVGAVQGFLSARRSIVQERWRGAKREFGNARDLTRFFDGRRRHFVHCYFEATDGPTSVSWTTLARRYGFDGEAGPCDVFLKMDIENAEYRTLDGILRYAERITGLAIEFHSIDHEWDRFARLMDALQESFMIAHIHGNNCAPLIVGSTTPTVLEVTFVNRRLVDGTPPLSTRAYPRDDLDRPCCPNRPDYPLAL